MDLWSELDRHTIVMFDAQADRNNVHGPDETGRPDDAGPGFDYQSTVPPVTIEEIGQS
ncbi:hypothetical protein FHT76_007211 [Rhizobium sp. BK176]|nr:hypothetical protein [Rhizobium sp. BK176]